MNAIRPQLSADLVELVQRATAHFAALSPSAQLRHRYMQRRSFAKWAGRDMPHEAGLSDAEIAERLL